MICVPVVGPSMREALEDIKSAEAVADIIEFRIDLIADPQVSKLIEATGKPCIVTNRTKLEGGQFKGTEEQRVNLLREAIQAGADYIDIESSTPPDLLRSILESSGKTKTILSYHNFTNTPDNMEGIYQIMADSPADILKIVTYATDITDNLRLFDLLERAKKDGRPLIAFCMGEKGEVSRILSPMYGGFLTFGSLEKGKESAPGQIYAATLKNIYRVNDLKSDAKIYGVIGDPVSKSMGYLIHNKAFQEIGLPDIYVPFWVKSLGKFFQGFQSRFEGLSVTMPHKEEIIPYLDHVDNTAQRIGAVNTVVREDNRWVGYNTDCSGAMRALGSKVDVSDKEVLIIGSGGTAKAIGHGIVKKGGNLTVTYNRNKARGEELAKELNCNVLSSREAQEKEYEILINCSPVGMTPNVNESPFPSRRLQAGMTIFDSVYNPMETKLIREAKSAGCKTISGLELFINQAVDQFELWTGRTAPTSAMRQVVLEKLKS